MNDSLNRSIPADGKAVEDEIPNTGSRPRLLVVDDDLSSLIMAQEALEDAGFDVLQAEDGLEAVELCEKHSPDLIIMDVIMPRMNGFEACTRIQEKEWGQHIPILMVTGLEDIESINRAYEAGATDFLTKPINFFVLPHRVRYMLRNKHTADELRASQSQLDQAQRIAQLGHWEWNRRTKSITWSKACSLLLPVQDTSDQFELAALVRQVHLEDQEKIQQQFIKSINKGEEYNVECRVPGEGNTLRMIRVQGEPRMNDANVVMSILGTIQDVTERYNAQQQIHNLAYYDHITGLPNRAMLSDRLNGVLSKAERQEHIFAVLFLDLDRFKQVNDTLGHDAGDDLLLQVSTRLVEVLEEYDAHSTGDSDRGGNSTIARLGGDEFVVLMPEISKTDDAARVARVIAAKIAETYIIKDSTVNISTTIGISIYPHDGSDAESLLKNADIAMYHAKKRGRNGFQFYSEEIHENAQVRFSLEQDLRRAITEQQFRLVYQPKVASATGAVSGVEALVRWDHPTMGQVAPQEFITLAEETELIIPLGEWIFKTACEQLVEWHQQGFDDLHMAVNCSSIQLMRTDIPKMIRGMLEKTGLDPKFLEVELTESILLDDAERGIAILEDLRTIGIMTSIDDFGTGFSSMSYLRRLPVNKLKIDRSFVGELGVNDSDAAIVSAILTLAKHLDLKVVAEGVETIEQQSFLVNHECDELQGFYISKPLEASDFYSWMEFWQTRNSRLAG